MEDQHEVGKYPIKKTSHDQRSISKVKSFTEEKKRKLKTYLQTLALAHGQIAGNIAET